MARKLSPVPSRIFIIGIDGEGRTGGDIEDLANMVKTSELLVGSPRQISLLKNRVPEEFPRIVDWAMGAARVVKEISNADRNVLVLASGDPGYFGVVRLLKRNFPAARLDVRPLATSVSLAFAKAETNWEDAAVISAHGRSYDKVITELLRALDPPFTPNKLAVLCSPEHPPQVIAQLLFEARAKFDRYLVCSDLGSDAENVIEAPLDTICELEFDPFSILLGIKNDVASEASLSNLPNHKGGAEFLHRRNMITKPEARGVILSKLSPHLSANSACLWDLGAGSGSVGLTAIQHLPQLRLFLVESDPIQLRLLRINSSRFPGAFVIPGRIQDEIANLPHPDAVFVGGGGVEILSAVKATVTKPTFVLASFAGINKVSQAADLLGNMMEIMLPVGKRLPDGSWRLESENPIFISWGLLG